MKKLIIFLLLFTIHFSANCEWFNVNHPDTANIEVMGNRGDTLFTFQKDYIIYYTMNFGIDWSSFSKSVPSNKDGIAISREGNIILSVYPLGIILSISTDCGATFNRNVIITMDGFSFYDIGRINSRYIYAEAFFDWWTVLILTKDGQNTVSITDNDYLFYLLDHSIIFNNFNIIGNFNDTLYRSDDSGKTFIKLENIGITELGLCEENNIGKLFMLVHDTVFTSIDSGWTWQKMGLSLTGLLYINIDNQDNIYLRTDKNIFCSYDDGLNWTDITENLPLTTSKYPELRFSDSKIFVHADEGNIYYRDITLNVEDNTIENKLTLYPNPVNNFLQLKFKTNELYTTRIEIYSALGEKVIETEFKERVDVGNFSPGIYFCTIKSGKNFATRKFVVIR